MLSSVCTTKKNLENYEYLCGLICKAMKHANDDPEASLMYARKSVEGICTSIFSKEIGDPGNNRLNKLVELLSNQEKLPERVKVILRVIQHYGNYGAHVQSDKQMLTPTIN